MNQNELSKRLQELGFILVELNLYLDTHPDCMQAREVFNRYSAEMKQLREQYESRYGATLNFGLSAAGNEFDWINSPWPWEN